MGATIPVTAEEVYNVRFSPKARGYDDDEVDAFLDRVIVTLREQSPLGILQAAQEVAEKTIAEAQQEADQIRAGVAELKAFAVRYRATMLSEIDKFYRQAEDFPVTDSPTSLP